MRELTASSEPHDDSEILPTHEWFKFTLSSGARVTVATVGVMMDSIEDATMELIITIKPRRGPTRIEKIDMVEFAARWALAITKDRKHASSAQRRPRPPEAEHPADGGPDGLAGRGVP